MDIRQLCYFIAIAEEKNISSAAKRLHMAQPPLSQQLKKMEKELGVLLIERNGRTLELTEAGHTLYRHAQNITRMMAESQREVTEVGEGLKGKLTIGINTLSWDGLPRLLHRYQQKYPQISYKIQQNESAHLCKLVKMSVPISRPCSRWLLPVSAQRLFRKP